MADTKNMYYGATPTTFEKAKALRNNMTYHEKLLWEELRSNKILGFRFKSQHPIDTFIADFYCHRLKVVIEVDGEYHSTNDQKEYDEGRTSTLKDLDINVIRFTNQKIETSLHSVVESIKEYCSSKLERSPLQGIGGKTNNL